MKKMVMSFVSLSVLALLGSGCVSLEAHERVQKHLETEQEANRALAAENARMDGEIGKLRGSNSELEASIKEMRALVDKEPTLDEQSLLDKIKEVWGGDMRSNDWEFVQNGGAVGVRMDDSGVLFKSGSWTLTDGTKGKLTELANMMKPKLEQNNLMFCRVDGHTDSDPVRKLKAKGIEDNVHLSAMRAMAVRDFLVSKGMPKDRIFIAGFGEHWPVEGGSSSKAKQRNRRVEVFLGDANALSIGALPGAQVQK